MRFGFPALRQRDEHLQASLATHRPHANGGPICLSLPRLSTASLRPRSACCISKAAEAPQHSESGSLRAQLKNTCSTYCTSVFPQDLIMPIFSTGRRPLLSLTSSSSGPRVFRTALLAAVREEKCEAAMYETAFM